MLVDFWTLIDYIFLLTRKIPRELSYVLYFPKVFSKQKVLSEVLVIFVLKEEKIIYLVKSKCWELKIITYNLQTG